MHVEMLDVVELRILNLNVRRWHSIRVFVAEFDVDCQHGLFSLESADFDAMLLRDVMCFDSDSCHSLRRAFCSWIVMDKSII